MIKVTKKMLKDSKRCLIGDGIISSGHWLIKKELIENAALFSSIEIAQASFPGIRFEDIEDGKVKTITDFDTEGVIEYQSTKVYLSLGSIFGNVFTSEKGLPLIINSDYIKALGLEGFNLYGTGPLNPCFNAPMPEDTTIVVMPVQGIKTAMDTFKEIIETAETFKEAETVET